MAYGLLEVGPTRVEPAVWSERDYPGRASPLPGRGPVAPAPALGATQCCPGYPSTLGRAVWSRASTASSIRADTFALAEARTTRVATTSVRLWVTPPARKKRLRTRPSTATSVPASSADAHAGASNQLTGTGSA